ncbi:MAG: type II toxin-antitoxin system HicB family antitoxin [Chloroflexota bacterium]|nr:type II toxin-antitoxin system HicB family antitoxin [Chloroflexota bacterium]MDQ6907992.1 type II toxin-antitoxin system HicB family antitoxin [Chloroflexota bacterium]
MTTMTYKGYTAEVAIDPDVEVFAGRVLYLRDVIYFEGETVEDVEQEFHLSIDDYLAWAAEDGFKPDHP